jgi:hypothetical protein
MHSKRVLPAAARLFVWEYKSRGGELEKANDQFLRYAGARENPPPHLFNMDKIIVVQLDE